MALLKRHGISPKKGLGQHFLCSSKVVSKIASRFEGYAGLLEIGPGPGVLTQALSESVCQFTAIEVDSRMAAILAESAPSAQVVEADALVADLSGYLRDLPEPRGVVSNLPYYITAPLLQRIAEARASWCKAVLMTQKEVGVRILAPPGSRERGSLSVYLQALFQISSVCDVPPGAFLPPPKVDSIVLEFVPRDVNYTEEFFAFVRGGFKQPRKTLANNLAALGFSREAVVHANLDELVRPQALNLEQWIELFHKASPFTAD